MQQTPIADGSDVMAAIEVTWSITITSDGKHIGQAILTSTWDVISKLAAIRAAIPVTWHAEAYPLV